MDWAYQLITPLRNHNGEYNFPSRPPANPDPFVPNFRYPDRSSYVPMPQPGGQHGPGFDGWMSWLVKENMREVAETDAPVGILLRNRNVPFPYYTEGRGVDPDAFEAALASLDRLDFVFMDLEYESDMIERNTIEIVRMIREHPNPKINQAIIGNYEDYPGLDDPAGPWEHQRDRRRAYGSQNWNRNSFYGKSGMNVAMPAAYPYESYSVHATERYQRNSGACPNLRAAMFWAPLQRVGVAKQNLPEGHLLVPWVSNFVNYIQPDPNDYYFGPPPPREDLVAMITHIRLRGADGFVVWTRDTEQTDHPTIGYSEYRDLALDTWRSHDELLPLGTPIECLNLADPKTSGVVWSGAIANGNAIVIVSNLSGNGQPVSVRLPQRDGLPASTEPVPDGSHRVFVYPLAGSQARGASTGQDDSGSDGTGSGGTGTASTTNPAGGENEADASGDIASNGPGNTSGTRITKASPASESKGVKRGWRGRLRRR